MRREASRASARFVLILIDMRKRAMLSSACASLAVLALSACSWGDKPEASPSPSPSPTLQSPSPSPSPSPSVSAEEPLPAGIPTHEPGPGAGEASALTAHLTLASFDLESGGMLVGGFVSGASQDGGDCEFVITPASGPAVTVHGVGVENGASTSCGSQIVPSASVPSGDYSVVLKYSNGGVTATSDAVKVTIP